MRCKSQVQFNILIMTKKVKQVIEMLEENGWIHERTKGDHRVFVKQGAKRPIVVAGKLSDDMPQGTYSSITRQMNATK